MKIPWSTRTCAGCGWRGATARYKATQILLVLYLGTALVVGVGYLAEWWVVRRVLETLWPLGALALFFAAVLTPKVIAPLLLKFDRCPGCDADFRDKRSP